MSITLMWQTSSEVERAPFLREAEMLKVEWLAKLSNYVRRPIDKTSGGRKLSKNTLRRRVLNGKALKTSGGLQQEHLVKNKKGKVVPISKLLLGKNCPWILALQSARKVLGIKGAAVPRKGSPLYKKTKELMEHGSCANIATKKISEPEAEPSASATGD